ncbi:type I CRISPR-associated protein Cas8a1/Csx8 [Cetobacterium sp. SF1]|uniref:type I CRISPR-associated protein Cas8a1/Csx8 n=1 Tax=Cetobacterium sp. SF1 TaxID=3417654 RepID=UPI003CEAB69D
MALVRLEPWDWRWGASILGLTKYFDYFQDKYELTEDYLEFDDDNITEDKYYKFVEEYFEKNMHHKDLESLIKNITENEEQEKNKIKAINEKLKANKVMKKIFLGCKFDGSNSEEIINLLNENRKEIIENTYKNGKSLYANFGNSNLLLKSTGKVCRVNGFYMDMGKKGKSITYGFDSKTLVYTDSIYFDFIPFGFSRSREAVFINCNLNLINLKQINKTEFDEAGSEENRKTFKSNLLNNSYRASKKIDCDMEVIVKDMEKDYFESLYIRKDAINILNKISDEIKEVIGKPCKTDIGNSFSSTEWIPVEKIVVDNILNLKYLDDFIEYLFKVENKKTLRGSLIKINRLIYKEGEFMKKNYAEVIEDGSKIKEFFKTKPNKLRSYEQKLVSAITLKDYDRVKEIMLHLSSYSQLPIRALILLFEDFEKNKNLAYTFINSIGEKKSVGEEKNGK